MQMDAAKSCDWWQLNFTENLVLITSKLGNMLTPEKATGESPIALYLQEPLVY